MPFFYMDYWYLILVVPALLVSLWAQQGEIHLSEVQPNRDPFRYDRTAGVGGDPKSEWAEGSH